MSRSLWPETGLKGTIPKIHIKNQKSSYRKRRNGGGAVEIFYIRKYFAKKKQSGNPPSYKALDKICEVLGTTMSDFFDETYTQTISARRLSQKIFETFDEEDIIKFEAALKSMSRTDVKALIRVMEMGNKNEN